VKGEIMAYLKMMGEVYDIFGLDYKMALSTRPEGYLGELEVWNQAEKALEEALNETGRQWEVSGHTRGWLLGAVHELGLAL
jgi:threonyl-tRNA synthetase